MREVRLLRKAGAALGDGKQVLGLEDPLDLNTMFSDATCVKAKVHFPVDWCFCATESSQEPDAIGGTDPHSRAEIAATF